MLALTVVMDKDFVKIGEGIFVKVNKMPGTKQVKIVVQAPANVIITRSTRCKLTLEEGSKYFNGKTKSVSSSGNRKPN